MTPHCLQEEFRQLSFLWEPASTSGAKSGTFISKLAEVAFAASLPGERRGHPMKPCESANNELRAPLALRVATDVLSTVRQFDDLVQNSAESAWGFCYGA